LWPSFQKNLSEILPSNGLSPGPGEVGQGGLKVLHLWCHAQKIRTPQPKNFCSSADEKPCCIYWAFEQLSTIFGARVTLAKPRAIRLFWHKNPQKQPDV